MTRMKSAKVLIASAAALLLAGCGGGGSAGINFIPAAPPVTSTPTPTPTPAPTPAPPPIAPPHLGLVSAAPFAVLGIGDTYKNGGQTLSGPSARDVQFSYIPSTNSYQMSLPGFEVGTLANTSYNGVSGQAATSSTSQVTTGSSSALQQAFVSLAAPGSHFSPYTYTSFGWWETGLTAATGDGPLHEGIFAYGIPTQVGDVPITGSANYSAEVHGTIGVGFLLDVTGTADLAFDFAGGKLSGSMHAGVFDEFDGFTIDFGKYDFTQTVYSTGSTTFSGKFIVPGLPNADSSFEGNFTGPNAAELMARFAAPYLFNGQQGAMSGVWVGKKN